MNFRKFTIPLFFLTLMIISSFTSRFPAREKWIPEGFNPAKGTLLIAEHPSGEKENDKMINFIDKEYTWNYEVASKEQLQKEKKYQNRKVYKYELMWADSSSNSLDPGSPFRFHDIDGYFVDLTTGTEYPRSGYGYLGGMTGYKKVINAIKKAFKDDE